MDLREELLEAFRRRADALAAADTGALLRLLHPDFRWTSHRGEVFDRDGYVSANTAGELTWRSQTLLEPTVVLVGDTAVLAGVVRDEVVLHRRVQTFEMPVTQTWVRVGSAWLLLAGHAGPRLNES